MIPMPGRCYEWAGGKPLCDAQVPGVTLFFYQAINQSNAPFAVLLFRLSSTYALLPSSFFEPIFLVQPSLSRRSFFRPYLISYARRGSID